MPAEELCNTATKKTAGTTARFNMANLSQALLSDPEITRAAPALIKLPRYLTNKEFAHVARSLFRFSFLIELVTAAANTTLYETRWSGRLEDTDPRRASPSECSAILDAASQLALEAASKPVTRTALTSLLATSRVPLELPLDYIRRSIGQVHQAGNLRWLPADLIVDLAAQRTVLLDSSSDDERRVFREAFEKIRVKSYRTDRVLTGVNKTNREWRWESHPSSVHFALREDCMRIERELLRELAGLHDLPDELAAKLVAAGLRSATNSPTRCPVTQDLLSYAELAAEMLDRRHGKSSFHVGHLNPLKAVNDDPESGHTARNIAWISEDGNRIQGHHPLRTVVDLLRRVARNYRSLGRPLE